MPFLLIPRLYGKVTADFLLNIFNIFSIFKFNQKNKEIIISFSKKRFILLAAASLLILCGIYFFKAETFLGLFNKWTDYRVINTHEHLSSAKELDKLLPAMQKTGQIAMVLVGSPQETLGGTNEKDFTGYALNNERLIDIKQKYPRKFYIFSTLDPRDSNKLNKLISYQRRGNTGLKLYNGHGNFYPRFGMSLDDPEMDEVYAYCAEHRVPLVWHVNGGKYLKEFENVLKKYPALIVSVPHFALLSKRMNQLRRLMTDYPNLYTDISFGSTPFLVDGFKEISQNQKAYQHFFLDFQDRILFGTDEVLTASKKKDINYLINRYQCHRDLLKKETFTCPLIDEFEKTTPESPLMLNGLNLPKTILKKIYETNPKQFLGIK